VGRPTSLLGQRAAGSAVSTPDGFQFHGGVLRAVSGDGGAWLREMARAFPGMRLQALGFGLLSPAPSTVERAGVRLTDVGCTLSVVDARQRGVDASTAAHRGLTFCLNGPGLDVDINDTPVLRDGEFVEPRGAHR
jgi:hypothetical protein